MGNENPIWAHLIIDTLVNLGVTHFFCAPGSRSTPLMLALSEKKIAKAHIHFDERGLGFEALGFAKGSEQPVAIIVTSGTAVMNLLPAIMEAYHSYTPLIVLSADRPPELLDVGANQTCNQVQPLTFCTRYQIDLPTPDLSLSSYLQSTLHTAVSISKTAPYGPVHINCPFREPLGSKSINRVETKQRENIEGLKTLSEEQAHKISSLLKGSGVIIAGDGCETEGVLNLAEALNWPIFPDILSSMRKLEHPLLIHNYELILKTHPDLKINTCLQIGNRFVSKTLFEWLKKQSLEEYIHIADHHERHDPHHLVTKRVHASLKSLCVKQQENPHPFTELQKATEEALFSFFATQERLTEPSLMFTMREFLEKGWRGFIGNSMPIRDANTLFSCVRTPLFGNRGVSGIDGNIATAVGIAKALKEPMFAVIGDLTALHDINSLSLVKDLPTPFVLFIINNQGGGIFSFLPLSTEEVVFEKFFAAFHSFDFEHAAEMFHIDYLEISDLEALHIFLQSPRSCIVEIKTKREDNVFLRNEILGVIPNATAPSIQIKDL